MTKKVLKRGSLGFLIGAFITVLIPLIISFFIADGNFYPVVPDFIEQCGNEVNAAAIQYLLGGIMGFGCAAGSVVFEHDKFSILKQTVIHFIIISLSMLPIAYICHWMEHSLLGLIKYFLIFIIIYFIIWITQYLIWKSKIKRMNEKLLSKSNE